MVLRRTAGPTPQFQTLKFCAPRIGEVGSENPIGRHGVTTGSGASAPLSILIVDDNPDDILVFRRAIRNQAWQVHEANTGSSGLQQALANRFDLIVLDYNLGDMTGTEILLRLKEAGLPTPILVQSGIGSHFIVARALALGAEGFLTKGSPDYVQEVVTKVQTAAHRARGTNQMPDRLARRESVAEVETVIDELMERSKASFHAVGFASPDGFRVSTRFKRVKNLSPETICAMVASAASTCGFLGEGLNLPPLRILTAEFSGGVLYAAPVPGFGILFGAVAGGGEVPETARKELEIAAKELGTLLGAMSRTEQYSY